MKTKLGQIAKRFAAFAISAAVLVPFAHSIAASANSEQPAANFQSIANSDLLVLGPVDRVDAAKFQIRVLGQVAVLPAAQRGIAIDALVGRLVALYGSLNAD